MPPSRVKKVIELSFEEARSAGSDEGASNIFCSVSSYNSAPASIPLLTMRQRKGSSDLQCLGPVPTLDLTLGSKYYRPMKHRTVLTQIQLTALVLLALSLLTAWWFVVIFGALLIGVGASLWVLNYRCGGRRPGDDKIIAWVGIAAIAPVAIGALLGPSGRAVISNRPDVLALVFPAAIALAGISASSMVDRFYVLPRLAGVVWQPPCRAPQEEAEFPPGDWLVLTRHWYRHRWAAEALTIGCGLAAAGAAAFAVLRPADTSSGIALGVGVVAASGIAAVRVKNVGQGADEGLHPTAHVGEVLQIANDRDATRSWYYVVDVALEGMKTLELADLGADGLRLRQKEQWKREDRCVPIADLRRLVMRHDDVPLCPANGCNKSNFYCRENPHAGHGYSATQLDH